MRYLVECACGKFRLLLLPLLLLFLLVFLLLRLLLILLIGLFLVLAFLLALLILGGVAGVGGFVLFLLLHHVVD